MARRTFCSCFISAISFPSWANESSVKKLEAIHVSNSNVLVVITKVSTGVSLSSQDFELSGCCSCISHGPWTQHSIKGFTQRLICSVHQKKGNLIKRSNICSFSFFLGLPRSLHTSWWTLKLQSVERSKAGQHKTDFYMKETPKHYINKTGGSLKAFF